MAQEPAEWMGQSKRAVNADCPETRWGGRDERSEEAGGCEMEDSMQDFSMMPMRIDFE